MTNTWIFQANPKLYKITEALKNLKQIRWSVRQHKKEIQKGDLVYFWRSGKDAGILGWGIIETEQGEYAPIDNYWIEEPEDDSHPSVLIGNINVFETPISRAALKEDPQLTQLSILVSPQGTNFIVTDEEAAALQETTNTLGGHSKTQNIWWVNQGHTYEEERKESLIWAPKVSKSGVPVFHWDNVKKLKEGDIIFHYAKDDIRALSIVSVAGHSEDNPSDIYDRPRDTEGWGARTQYHELENPIPKAKVGHRISKLIVDYGPINKNGNANQGYLFALNDAVTRVLAETLDLESLPEEIRVPLQACLDLQWDHFIHWGKRLLETETEWSKNKSGTVKDLEREFKLEIASKLALAKDALDKNSPDFFGLLKSAFGNPNSLTYHITHTRFLDWAQENEQLIRLLLKDLWDYNNDDAKALTKFLSSLPNEAVKGPGTRTNIGSFLSLATYPERAPIYQPTPYRAGCELTGFKASPDSDYEIYAHALEFLDRIIEEAAKRNYVLADRLDAQTLLYCAVKYDAPGSWEEEERTALQNWRDNNGYILKPSPTKPPQTIKPSPPPKIRDLNSLADDLYLDVKHLKDIDRLIKKKKQVIFHGPPGTGKTYLAKELADYYAGDSGEVTIVQFHPSYTYEDFIEGFRPKILENGQPGFSITDGPLKTLAAKAHANPQGKYILLIDEINRGNIAKVFGELYFLLEYRDEQIGLQYNRENTFSLPKNLWIIGTMNTADRSIALLDSALRRRFYFIPFFPDKDPIKSLLRNWLQANKPDYEWLADVVAKANEQLGDRHNAIGPSYFLDKDLDDDWIETIWEHAIIPYIEEYFYDQPDVVKDFELDSLKIKPEPPQDDATDLPD